MFTSLGYLGAPAAPAAPAAPLVLPEVADKPFYEAVLRGLEAPLTGNTLALIYAWRQTEGGKANYNPFNTTLKLPGSTLYGKNTHGVQNYVNPQQGVDATVRTMLHPRYASIIQLLRADATPVDVANAIISSAWGTKGLLLDVLTMYGKGKVVVNPISTVPGAPAISTLTPAVAAPGKAKPSRVRYEKPPTNWLAWGGIAMLAAAVILLPALLQSKSSVPSLPAPPKQNPRRRRRR